jgi:hypothetical protein
VLELAAALVSDPQRGRDLPVRLRFAIEEAVPPEQDLAVAAGEDPEQRPHPPACLTLVEATPRVGWVGVGDQFDERRPVRADRLVQRRRDVRRVAQ